ncbi:uncharacterized protein PHACADRAFT_72971, partial [Phanerochaete carnosa HHB-10118-sp]
FDRSWERLPPEMHDYIWSFVESSNNKAEVSRLSLVSRAHSRRFRPRLFASPVLRSEEDCHTLYSIVRSPLSAWLAEHVTTLRFHSTCFPNPPFWMTLVRFLPACWTIDKLNHDPLIPPGRISRTAALKSSLKNITCLKLLHCDFPSFRILLRVLGDIIHLESIDFKHVTWKADPLLIIDTVNNVTNGAFSHVNSIQMRSCTDNVAVPAWIFAAISTHHSFSRRQAAPIAPGETLSLIKFMQNFLGDDMIENSTFDAKDTDAGDSFIDVYTFVGYLSGSKAVEGSDTVTRMRVRLWVQLARSTSPGGDDESWSIHHIFITDSQTTDNYNGNGLYTDYLDSRNWSILPSLLTALPRLQPLEILCQGDRSETNFRAL